jgi:hypothetical protein
LSGQCALARLRRHLAGSRSPRHGSSLVRHRGRRPSGHRQLQDGRPGTSAVRQRDCPCWDSAIVDSEPTSHRLRWGSESQAGVRIAAPRGRRHPSEYGTTAAPGSSGVPAPPRLGWRRAAGRVRGVTTSRCPLIPALALCIRSLDHRLYHARLPTGRGREGNDGH